MAKKKSSSKKTIARSAFRDSSRTLWQFNHFQNPTGGKNNFNNKSIGFNPSFRRKTC